MAGTLGSFWAAWARIGGCVRRFSCARAARSARSVRVGGGRSIGGWVRAGALTAAVASTSVLSVSLNRAMGCGGGPPPGPPPQSCTRSTSLVKAVPGLIVPGPATMVPVTVFVASQGPCPAPAFTTVTITVFCPPPGGGMGVVVIPTPAPGMYPAVVPVPMVADPPRACGVVGTAVTTWADGVTTTGMGDAQMCSVESVPGSPGTPRVGFDVLSPPIQTAHPGDQRTHAIRLCNNDPTRSVTGSLTATSRQAARLSTMSPAPAAGALDFPASIATPVSGDDFPIDFADQSLSQWVVLGDPTSTVAPTITRTITLAPGQCRTFMVRQRSWPMCSCGSGAETNVRFDGLFTDGHQVAVCGTVGYVTDCNTAPDFGCPDGGSMATVIPQNGVQPGLEFFGPMPEYSYDGVSRLVQSSVTLGNGTSVSPQSGQASVLDQSWAQRRGRVMQELIPATAVPPGTSFTASFDIQTTSVNSAHALQLLAGDMIPGEASLGNSYFFINARHALTGTGVPEDPPSFFDVFFTVSLGGMDTQGKYHKPQITTSSITATPLSSSTLRVSFAGVFPVDAQLPAPITSIGLTLDGQTNAHKAITTGSCCVGTGCSVTSALDCAIAGGYWVRGEICGAASCPSEAPVRPGDIAYGASVPLNRDAVQQVRSVGGTPTRVGAWAQHAFIQSVKFDNGAGISHNPRGNLLGLDFGTVANGAILYNLSTNGAGDDQVLYRFNPGNPFGLAVNRAAGLSVSPDNTRIACVGRDSARVILLGYAAGPTPGTGAGASITSGFQTNPATFPFLGTTSATAWLNSSTLIAYVAVSGVPTIFTLPVSGSGLGPQTLRLTTTDTGVPNASRFMALAYSPAVSPFLYAMSSGFSTVTGNRLSVIDPATWTEVRSINLSSSLNTGREIAVGRDRHLYLGQFAGSGSIDTSPLIDRLNLDVNGNGVVTLADMQALSDNSSVDYYLKGTATTAAFNGLDVAHGCRADFNGDGVANSQDFFDFLTAFFNGSPSADFNGDGVVNSQDFFDFLTVFFAGCP